MKRKILPLIGMAAMLILSDCKNNNTGTEEGNGKDSDTSKTENTENGSSNDAGGGSKMTKRYGIEKGTIVYEYTGNFGGTETAYFDNWGMHEARYTEMKVKMGAQTIDTKRMSLTEDSMMYNYDFTSKTGSKTTNPMYRNLSNMKDRTAREIGEEMMKQMDAVKIGTETIAGKECDVYESKKNGTKICIWNNIAMKTELNMQGMKMSMLVKSISEDAPPADKMKLPDGVEKASLPAAGAPGNMMPK